MVVGPVVDRLSPVIMVLYIGVTWCYICSITYLPSAASPEVQHDMTNIDGHFHAGRAFFLCNFTVFYADQTRLYYELDSGLIT